MDFRNNRNTVLLAFILLMLAGVALLEASALVVLILLGLLFLVRQFDNNQPSSSSESQDYEYGSSDYEYGGSEYEYGSSYEEAAPRRQAQADPVYRHALESVQRAGHDPDQVQVLTVDIGMMAFKDNDEPTVFRTWSLPDDVDYVQPFVQLRLPGKATGRIKFEVIDATGNVVFAREDVHTLERGRNFVSPAARLPIHDETITKGQWGMRISADGVLLADHVFEFSEASNQAIRRHIGEDGEINTELRAVMAESRLPKMSLDQLLEFSDDEEQQQGRM